MNQKLSGWAAKHMSIAGRLVLLNVVLSALPMYFMMVMQLPKWVIRKIEKIRRKFMWHGTWQIGKWFASQRNMAI